MTPLEHIKMMKGIVIDINQILSENGLDENISLSDIIITAKTVSDLAMSNPKLSNAITNFLWPSITSATVYHFTSRKAAESILNTNIFRLYNIAKNYNAGEIGTFCKTHNLQGYLDLDETGNPKYRHLIMPNTFYASFTDTQLTVRQENYFWQSFASPNGVRLKLEIIASNCNFRKIHYEQKKGEPIPLISSLTQQIKDKYKRDFILKGISRLCSFYLSGDDYGIENEYRALHRVWGGFGPQPKNDGPNSYIELPLNVMSDCGYKLTVIEVHAKVKPIMPDSYTFSKRLV